MEYIESLQVKNSNGDFTEYPFGVKGENVTLKGKITAMEELVSRFERNKENNDEIGT